MQGIIGGFANGDPSAIQRRRAGDPFAALLAGLGVRVWLDAHDGAYLSTTGALVDTAIDRSGSGLDATASGSLRPAFDAGAFGGRGGMLFAGAQVLVTPAFSMGTRSSGCGVWRVDVTNSGLCEFGAFDTHSYVYHAGVPGTEHRVAGGGSEVQSLGTLSTTLRVTWRTDPSGIRARFNGVLVTTVGGTPSAATDSLYMGGLSRGTTLRLRGAIGELVFADALWSDAEMDAVDAALAQRW